MSLKKDLSTKENREYWQFIEGISRDFSKLPPFIQQLAGTKQPEEPKPKPSRNVIRAPTSR